MPAGLIPTTKSDCLMVGVNGIPKGTIMKSMSTLAFLSLLMIVGCAGGGPDLTGSWKLVETHGEAVGANGSVKSLTDTHFAFGMQADDRPFAGGGTWSLEGDAYTEHVEWHSHGVLIGRDITFSCRVEDDTWYHAADFIADGERFHIEEVWVRVTPAKTTSKH